MKDNKINYNEVLISGMINTIKTFDKFIAIGLSCNNYGGNNSKCYINIHIYKDLYNIYKDFFYKGNKIFVKGYLNSYTDKDGKIVCYVKITDVSDNAYEFTDGRKAPYIRYDLDGVMVWNGKRCESTPFDKDDPRYLELLETFKEFE